MSRTDRPSSESYYPKIGRYLNHLWIICHLGSSCIWNGGGKQHKRHHISYGWVGATAMDSYYVLRCHRHIKFISLHSSPSKKCRFSNARMTGERAGAPPIFSAPFTSSSVSLELSESGCHAWRGKTSKPIRVTTTSDPDSDDDGVQKG